MHWIRETITLSILFVSLYFEVFLLITYLDSRSKLHAHRMSVKKDEPDFTPAVTVIVPCFNESKTANATIHSILGLNYPQDKLKIILVNDGSTDDTQQVLEQFKTYPNISIIKKENGGKHTALNLGIKIAETEFVGCLDADSFATPESLREIMKRFKDEKVMAVVPSLHVFSARTLIERMQKVEYMIGVFFRSILSELNALYVTPGPFSIFRKSVFENIGYYRKAHNTEDMEMALRMQKNKLKIVSAHNAIIYTTSPKNLKALYKQRVRWTSGFLHNVRDYRELIFNHTHGHIGVLVIPVMIVSMASSIFVFSSLVYEAINWGIEWFTRYSVVGSEAFSFSWPSFNWFFLNTTPIALAGLVAFSIMLTFIILGSKLSVTKMPKIYEIASYAFLYILIAPWWMFRSLWNAISRKQAVWR